VTKRYAYRLWYSAKLRARAKNLEFTLSREFVEKGVLNGKCAVTKLKFSKKSSSKTHRSFAASIDRIDSKLGYTDSNCQIVCWIYNRAKGNGTHKEVLILAEALVPSKSKKAPVLAVGRGEKLPVDKGAGLTAKGREKYNAATGSNLKAPAPHPKSKADAGRRKSFCARMSGMPGPMKDENGKPTRKAASLKRWNCSAK